MNLNPELSAPLDMDTDSDVDSVKSNDESNTNKPLDPNTNASDPDSDANVESPRYDDKKMMDGRSWLTAPFSEIELLKVAQDPWVVKFIAFRNLLRMTVVECTGLPDDVSGIIIVLHLDIRVPTVLTWRPTPSKSPILDFLDDDCPLSDVWLKTGRWNRCLHQWARWSYVFHVCDFAQADRAAYSSLANRHAAVTFDPLHRPDGVKSSNVSSNVSGPRMLEEKLTEAKLTMVTTNGNVPNKMRETFIRFRYKQFEKEINHIGRESVGVRESVSPAIRCLVRDFGIDHTIRKLFVRLRILDQTRLTCHYWDMKLSGDTPTESHLVLGRDEEFTLFYDQNPPIRLFQTTEWWLGARDPESYRPPVGDVMRGFFNAIFPLYYHTVPRNHDSIPRHWVNWRVHNVPVLSEVSMPFD